MKPFETGNPEAQVFYQELISKEEAKISAGFLEIDQSRFDWELSYEEIDYVISGNLEITIEGQNLQHVQEMLFSYQKAAKSLGVLMIK